MDNLIIATQHDGKAETCRRCRRTHKKSCSHPWCCPWCRQAASAGSSHVGCTAGWRCPLAAALRKDTGEQDGKWESVTQYSRICFDSVVNGYRKQFNSFTVWMDDITVSPGPLKSDYIDPIKNVCILLAVKNNNHWSKYYDFSVHKSKLTKYQARKLTSSVVFCTSHLFFCDPTKDTVKFSLMKQLNWGWAPRKTVLEGLSQGQTTHCFLFVYYS